MKKFILLLGGVAAAAVCLLVTRSRSTRSIDELSSQLKEAWADHHTVA